MAFLEPLNHSANGSTLLGSKNCLKLRLHEVEFPDGMTDTFTANLIAENLYLQVDEEGNSYSIFSEIVDHKSDGTVVSKDDVLEVDKHGQTRPC
jgi:hypothetical protein